MTLTQQQVSTIKATVPILQDHGIALCNLFYKSLLADNKTLNAVFSQTNQTTGAQPRALAGSLLAYAQHIDDLGVLSPAVERICQKHASMYIRPEQYETVGTYLLDAMAEQLGPQAFTADVKDAWAAGYWQLANLMIEREKQLYADDPEWNGWREFVIVDKIGEAEDFISVILKPRDGKPLPDYKPGQFLSVNVEVPALGCKQTRQYSLSDRPHTDHYRISVKKDIAGNERNGCVGLPKGVVSNIIHDDIRIGDVVEVSKPRGVFYVDADEHTDRPLALISAGSGVTPMVAVLESLDANDSPRPVHWIHVTRNGKTHAFKKRVKELEGQMKLASLQVLYSQPSSEDVESRDYHLSGRVGPKHLLGGIGVEGSECCVCGPSSFMDNVADELKRRGVPDDMIKMELFGTGGLPEPNG